MRTKILIATAALLMAAASIPAQMASVSLYGAACQDHHGTSIAPILQVSGQPQLGSQISIDYVGPNLWNVALPILITGTSSANIPVPRLSSGMSANCTLLVTPDIAVIPMPMVLYPRDFLDRVAYVIPNVPTVLGATVYHQWTTYVTTDTPNPQDSRFEYMLFSNAARITAGL